MAKISRQVGTTSLLVDVFIQNNSVTTGAGLTGLVYNTSGLTAYYHRNTASASVAMSLATMTLGTWATLGFIVVDGTNMPGVYQIGIPNAALVTGADSVVIYLQGAANMAPLVLEIELTATSNQDAVHGGMSALPNTACTTNASLLTSGTSTDQIHVDGAGNAYANVNKWLTGTIPAVNVTGVPIVDLKYTLGTLSPAAAGAVSIDWAQVANPTSTVVLSGTTVHLVTTTTTVTNQLTAAAIATGLWQDSTSGDFTVANSIGKSLYTSGATPGASGGLFIAGTNAATAVTTSFTTTFTGNLTGTVGSVVGAVGSISGVTFPTNFAALGISAGGKINEVILCDTLTTYTSNTPQTGDSYARLGAPAGASVSADILTANTAILAVRVTKNVALNGFMFYMALSSDHYSPATGLTITATRSLDGGAFGSCANAATEVANGWYKINLATTDTNGTVLILSFASATADTTLITIITQP